MYVNSCRTNIARHSNKPRRFTTKVEEHCLMSFIAKALSPSNPTFWEINNEYTKDCLANES